MQTKDDYFQIIYKISILDLPTKIKVLYTVRKGNIFKFTYGPFFKKIRKRFS